jgi:cytidyltransferase-like protein
MRATYRGRMVDEEGAPPAGEAVAAGRSRVYVDMVGDLFHAGHVTLLREARRLGDWLIVGVLSDDTAASYKRRPIMSLAERVAVIESCRYVDEVIEDAPFHVTGEFLALHDITTVVHGDDLSSEGAGFVYGPAAAEGKLQYVRRTRGISTTEVIQRVLDATASRPPCGDGAQPRHEGD